MIDPLMPEDNAVEAKQLSPSQIARRSRAKKRNIIAVSLSFGVCAILGVISAFLPEGESTPWMFASYAAGYVGFLWGLAGLWAHYMKTPGTK